MAAWIELLTYDRVTAAKLGLTVQSLDSTLYSAFGQSEVSIIYTQLNQYYVVMEVAPQYWQSPEGLKDIYLHTSGGSGNIPLLAVAEGQASTTPLAVNHTGLFPSVTVSFNLAPRRLLERCHPEHRPDAQAARHAFHDARLFCRHAARLPGISRHGAHC